MPRPVSHHHFPPGDAITVIERWTPRPWQRVAFCLIFLFPILGNLVARLHKGRWWLNDFDALICGADHVRRGLSPYGLHPVCVGTWPAVYVYAPQVAQVFAPMTLWGGLSGARLIWWLPCLVAMGYLLWYAVLADINDAPWRLRLMSLAAIVGSVFACGNIGLVLHALIIAGALVFRPKRLPFVAMVVASALVKPVMLTYLVVLLFERRPLIARLSAAAGASLLGLAAIGVEMLTAGRFAAEWHRTLNLIVMTQQPGISYFGWLNWVGLSPSDPVSLVLVGLFMLTTLIAGWILAESGKNDAQGDAIRRIAIGLGIAQMLNPRLMDYDMMALAPLMAITVMSAQDLGKRFFWAISWVFTAILTLDVLTNLLEIKAFARSPVTLFIYWLILLAVAGRLLVTQKRPEGIPGVFRAMLQGMTAL